MRRGLQESETFYNEENSMLPKIEYEYEESIADGSTKNVHEYKSVKSNQTDFDTNSQVNSEKEDEMTSIMAEMRGSENTSNATGDACPYFGEFEPSHKMKKKRDSIFTNMKKISLVNQSCVNIPKGLMEFHEEDKYISKTPNDSREPTHKKKTRKKRFTVGSMILPRRSFMRRAFTEHLEDSNEPMIILNRPGERSGSRKNKNSRNSSIVRGSPENSFQISRKQLSPFPGFGNSRIVGDSFNVDGLSRVMPESPGLSSKKMMFSGLDLLMGISSNQDSQFLPLQVFENEKLYEAFTRKIENIYRRARLRKMRPFYNEIVMTDRRPLRMLRVLRSREDRQRRDFFDALCQYVFKQSKASKRFYRFARKYQWNRIKEALKSLVFAVSTHRMIMGRFKNLEKGVWKQNQMHLEAFFEEAKRRMRAGRLEDKKVETEERTKRVAQRTKHLNRLGGGLGSYMDDANKEKAPKRKNLENLIRKDSKQGRKSSPGFPNKLKLSEKGPEKNIAILEASDDSNLSNEDSRSEYEISLNDTKGSRSNSHSPETFRALMQQRDRLGSGSFSPSHSNSYSPRRINRNIFAQDCTSESRHNSITGADMYYYEPSTENANCMLKQSNFNTFFQGEKGSQREMSLSISQTTFSKNPEDISDFEDARLGRLGRRRAGSRSRPDLGKGEKGNSLDMFRSQKKVKVTDDENSGVDEGMPTQDILEEDTEEEEMSEKELTSEEEVVDLFIPKLEDISTEKLNRNQDSKTDRMVIHKIKIKEKRGPEKRTKQKQKLKIKTKKIESPKMDQRKKRKRKVKNGLGGKSLSQVSGKSDQASVSRETNRKNRENKYRVKVEDLMIGKPVGESGKWRKDQSVEGESSQDREKSSLKKGRKGMEELLRKVRRKEGDSMEVLPNDLETKSKHDRRKPRKVSDKKKQKHLKTTGKRSKHSKDKSQNEKPILSSEKSRPEPRSNKEKRSKVKKAEVKDSETQPLIFETKTEVMTDLGSGAGSYGTLDRLTLPKKTSSKKILIKKSLRSIKQKKRESMRYISIGKPESKRYISLQNEDGEDFIGRQERKRKNTLEQGEIQERVSEENSQAEGKVRITFAGTKGGKWEGGEDDDYSGGDPVQLVVGRRGAEGQGDQNYRDIHLGNKKGIKTKAKKGYENDVVTKKQYKKRGGQKSNVAGRLYKNQSRQQMKKGKLRRDRQSSQKKKAFSKNVSGYSNIYDKKRPKAQDTNHFKAKERKRVDKGKGRGMGPRAKSSNLISRQRNVSRNKKSGSRVAAYVHSMTGQDDDCAIRISFSKRNSSSKFMPLSNAEDLGQVKPDNPIANSDTKDEQDALKRSRSAVLRRKRDRSSFSIKSPKNYFAEDREKDRPGFLGERARNEETGKKRTNPNSHSNSLLAVLSRGQNKFRSQKMGSEDEWIARPKFSKFKPGGRRKQGKAGDNSEKSHNDNKDSKAGYSNRGNGKGNSGRKDSDNHFIHNVDLREPKHLGSGPVKPNQQIWNKTSISNSLFNLNNQQGSRSQNPSNGFGQSSQIESRQTQTNVFFKKNEAQKVNIDAVSNPHKSKTKQMNSNKRVSESSRQTQNSRSSKDQRGTHSNQPSSQYTRSSYSHRNQDFQKKNGVRKEDNHNKRSKTTRQGPSSTSQNINTQSEYTNTDSRMPNTENRSNILRSDVSKMSFEADSQFKAKMKTIIAKLSDQLGQKRIPASQKLKIISKLVPVLNLFEKYFETLVRTGSCSEDGRRLLLIVQDIAKPLKAVLRKCKGRKAEKKIEKKIEAVRIKNLTQILEFLENLLKKEFLNSMNTFSRSSSDASKRGPASYQFSRSSKPQTLSIKSSKTGQYPVPRNTPIQIYGPMKSRAKAPNMRFVTDPNQISSYIFSSEIQERTPRFSNTTDLARIKKPYRNTYSKPSKYFQPSVLLEVGLMQSELQMGTVTPQFQRGEEESLGSYNKYRTPSRDIGSFCVLLGHKMRFKTKKQVRQAFEMIFRCAEDNFDTASNRGENLKRRAKTHLKSHQERLKSGKGQNPRKNGSQSSHKGTFSLYKKGNTRDGQNKLYSSKNTSSRTKEHMKRSQHQNQGNVRQRSQPKRVSSSSKSFGRRRLSEVLKRVRRVIQRLTKCSKIKMMFCLKMLKVNSLRINMKRAKNMSRKQNTKRGL